MARRKPSWTASLSRASVRATGRHFAEQADLAEEDGRFGERDLALGGEDRR